MLKYAKYPGGPKKKKFMGLNLYENDTVYLVLEKLTVKVGYMIN